LGTHSVATVHQTVLPAHAKATEVARTHTVFHQKVLPVRRSTRSIHTDAVSSDSGGFHGLSDWNSRARSPSAPSAASVCAAPLASPAAQSTAQTRPVIVDHRDSSAGDRGMADYRHGQLSMAAARAHSFAPSAAGASSSSSSRSPRMWENRIIPTTSCLACRLARPYCGGLQTGVDRSLVGESGVRILLIVPYS
jgi:hypothetical protein